MFDVKPGRSPEVLALRRYRLACPAECAVPTVRGPQEAARLVDQHPATCPDPGPDVGGIHPFVYADLVAR